MLVFLCLKEGVFISEPPFTLINFCDIDFITLFYHPAGPVFVYPCVLD